MKTSLTDSLVISYMLFNFSFEDRWKDPVKPMTRQRERTMDLVEIPREEKAKQIVPNEVEIRLSFYVYNLSSDDFFNQNIFLAKKMLLFWWFIS